MKVLMLDAEMTKALQYMKSFLIFQSGLNKSYLGGIKLPQSSTNSIIMPQNNIQKETIHKTYKLPLLKNKMELDIVLEKQEEGGYTAYVPALPGCISEGDTKEEAINNIKEAILLYLSPDENELIIYKNIGEVSRVIV